MPWQVQEAKQRLSEVLRAAEGGQPQVITRHGQDVAVVIDIASYRRLAGVQVELADFLRHGPSFDDLDLRRPKDRPREADIASVTDR
ncbi:prevent-host-death protein [Actinotalea ferrariae CF5-4]|uniref:Antitoxin n=1 Tax=Actinotalea ferrariae CF5-4 TaxID=948458 RepID=A0A021VS87_9CELL|nr:type II toxin-antitoxin system Phd/YefM family antitoxin [Actinotalea ferrariae]EYR64069.1 prevent-host-death protein [Actinotalea ferrariae CF5-4]